MLEFHVRKGNTEDKNFLKSYFYKTVFLSTFFTGIPQCRRKIWMRIARHVVERERDIGRAMGYLRKSGDLVKVEDVLPFFPDFVTIDHFKVSWFPAKKIHLGEMRRYVLKVRPFREASKFSPIFRVLKHGNV